MGFIIFLMVLAMLAIVGVGLAIAMRLRASNAEDKVGALADEIPWRQLIADGIVQCEGGRLLVGWQIAEGVDLASQSFKKQAMTVASAAQALIDAADASSDDDVGPGGSESLQIDWNTFREVEVGYPYNHDVVPRDTVTQAMFESRTEFFSTIGKQYVNETFMTLTWTPPSTFHEVLASIAVRKDGEGQARFDAAISQLQDLVEKVADSCDATWKLRRLTAKATWMPARRVVIDEEDGEEYAIELPEGEYVVDELLQLLHRCFTHENHEIELPDTAVIGGVFHEAIDLEGIVADQDLEATFTPKIGEYHFGVVQIEKFRAGGTSPDALRRVTNIPMPMRTSIRAIVATADEVEKKANRRFAMFKTNSDRREGKRRNLVAEKKADSAQNVDTESHRWWHWNAKVILAAETKSALKTATRRVKKAMHAARFGARIEKLGNPSALAASWPGECRRDRSESLIDETTLSDLAPVGTPYRGPKAHPNPSPALDYNPPLMRALGIGNTPVDIYDSVGDVANLGVLGEIGGGKTTQSNGIIELERATTPDIDHAIFEQGYGARPYVQGAGGDHIDADPSNEKTGSCPYLYVEEEEEREIWTQWVLDNLRLQNLPIGPQREEYVRRSMEQLAKSVTRSGSLFQRKLATYDDEAAQAFTPWTVAGPGGFLFDKEYDTRRPLSDAQRSLVCYEMSRLLRYNDERITGPLVTMAFNRLYRHMVLSKRRVRIHLDEPKDYFANPVFAPILAGFYDKITRKHHGGIRIFTQHPQQFLEHSIATSILGATKTWIFVATPQASSTQRDLFMEKFDLTEEACELIAKIRAKKQLVIWQEGHLSVVDPAWRAPELAFIGATDKRDRDEVIAIQQRFPQTWQGKWFEFCAARHRRKGELEASRACEKAAARWFELARAKGEIADDSAA